MSPAELKPENFSKNLNTALDFLGMSSIELSEKSGLTNWDIQQYLSGHHTPDIASLCKILKVLPIKFERLVQ